MPQYHIILLSPITHSIPSVEASAMSLFFCNKVHVVIVEVPWRVRWWRLWCRFVESSCHYHRSACALMYNLQPAIAAHTRLPNHLINQVWHHSRLLARIFLLVYQSDSVDTLSSVRSNDGSVHDETIRAACSVGKFCRETIIDHQSQFHKLVLKLWAD